MYVQTTLLANEQSLSSWIHIVPKYPFLKEMSSWKQGPTYYEVISC